jgi:hypothetical protein
MQDTELIDIYFTMVDQNVCIVFSKLYTINYLILAQNAPNAICLFYGDID